MGGPDKPGHDEFKGYGRKAERFWLAFCTLPDARLNGADKPRSSAYIPLNIVR